MRAGGQIGGLTPASLVDSWGVEVDFMVVVEHRGDLHGKFAITEFGEIETI